MTKPLDPQQSVVYKQNQGGGGAGLGLLLGPIGVAANMKMIETKTDEDVARLKGKLGFIPSVALQQAASASGFSLQSVAGTQDVQVTPYILVSKTNETTVHVSAMILVESPGHPAKWSRSYRYQLAGKYSLDELATADAARNAALQEQATQAYGALLRHMNDESDASISQETAITFLSPYLTPRFEFEQRGSLIRVDTNRVWVRTTVEVAAVAPTDLSYKVVK
ncbi:hypothetical protein [Undibacterium terreum]|nr:hypothetical protein [Undibacterium terreum]